LPDEFLLDMLQSLFTIVTDGLIYGSYLFIVAVGLTVIFGVQRVLNVTHGSFYAFGAYLAAYLGAMWYDNELPDFGGFVIIFLVAIVVGIVFGVLIERGLLKHLYGKDEHIVVLATFAAFLALEGVGLFIWGTDPYFFYQPQAMLGFVEIVGMTYDYYNLSLIALAFIIAMALWYFLARTIRGRMLQAVIFDREISQAMGINVTAVFLGTFILGTMLGALGGAAIAPTISVLPGIGVEVIVLAFAVVVIGGMGSVPGALIGSILVGVVRAAAVHEFPHAEMFVIYAIMAIVLVFRPEGLFAPPKVRKI